MEQVIVLVQEYEGSELVVTIFNKASKAEKYLADYCRELWEEWYSEDNTVGPLSSDNDLKAIHDFYEASEYDFYYLETHKVQ